ncbi:MAG: glycerol-3-phosphate dehydrogenase, partial [Elusimicrobia bacterium]|nr:glycerol-3-phosphate dehydrogenase [Elusimicrobiota bacterium]
GVPTRLALGGPAGPRAASVARALSGGAVRVEPTPDRVGVELGGSLKNVLAIGCGILDGLGAGANTEAALIVQGMGEMGRLIERLGGRRETIYGLAGLGDMIATGSSAQSRNRTLGHKLGQGKSLAQALKEIPTVAEGVESARSAHTLARAGRVPCPLVEAVWRVVHRGAPPRTVLKAIGF